MGGGVAVEVEEGECRVGGAVVIRACLRPEVQCFCLEHVWEIRILKAGHVVREWRLAARAGEPGYRYITLEWRPEESGEYRVEARLVSHGTASASIRVLC
ncbi:MAG: hypothetical protein DRJ96_09345 [Thermoprotei archaeon]|nr:MAG: hypothetical protein DRJ67_11945 [Thermoprotei archaeon]RLE94504.1 MAG: hypothetical protein DRJ96_09345 [Thermoprotei archaeon]